MADHRIEQLLSARGAKTRVLGNGTDACEVVGEHAVQLWQDLFEARSTTGLYPIIVGNTTNLRALDKAWQSQAADEEEEVSVPEWVEERLTEMKEDVGDDGSWEIPPRGPWPYQASHSREFHSVMSSSGTRYLGYVGIILIRGSEPWELPFVLGFGGWNECPAPAVHASFIRHWNERYGAVPVAFTGDVLEMAVLRQPVEPAEAIELAIEQFAYCPDIVDQGTETIEGLAAEIIGQPRWFFWWD